MTWTPLSVIDLFSSYNGTMRNQNDIVQENIEYSNVCLKKCRNYICLKWILNTSITDHYSVIRLPIIKYFAYKCLKV